MEGLPGGPWRFYLVPHTHWDREWYLPVEEFRLRFAHLVDEAIDVLDAEPRMRFTLDGQAVLLEDYLEYRPDPVQQARVRRLLESGRLSVGPAYVLPDEFLVGQESLIRNLLLGRAVCRRFGAEPAPIGYAPDTFGHPAQIPQLLAGFGLDQFIFMRGLGNEGEEPGAVFVRRGELLGGRFQTVTRGVNSSRMPLKQENERCERELHETETLASLATMVSNYRYPYEEPQVAWCELLRNQPHDSIGGCSVDRVHRDMLQRYSSCLELAGRLRREALAAMTGLGYEARWSQPAAVHPRACSRSTSRPCSAVRSSPAAASYRSGSPASARSC
jgi:alpha-mannosidase